MKNFNKIKESEGVTASEWFDKNHMNYKGIKSRHYAIEMLAAYARIKQPGLREELIKFDIQTYHDIHTKETSEIIVDEYLKQSKSK